MFGSRWEKAEATIVASLPKYTGDGTTVTYDHVADIRPNDGSPAFRAGLAELTGDDFRRPEIGDIVSVLVKANGKVKFDRDDPRLSRKAQQLQVHPQQSYQPEQAGLYEQTRGPDTNSLLMSGPGAAPAAQQWAGAADPQFPVGTGGMPRLAQPVKRASSTPPAPVGRAIPPIWPGVPGQPALPARVAPQPVQPSWEQPAPAQSSWEQPAQQTWEPEPPAQPAWQQPAQQTWEPEPAQHSWEQPAQQSWEPEPAQSWQQPAQQGWETETAQSDWDQPAQQSWETEPAQPGWQQQPAQQNWDQPAQQGWDQPGQQSWDTQPGISRKSEADPAARLSKLQHLRDQGLITDEEYSAQRRRVFDDV